MTLTQPSRPPLWFWTIGGLGLAWNAYGLVQFYGTVTATQDHLVATGMTPTQAELYTSLPLWMNTAFALGVGGGLAGCALLLLRRKLSLPVFAASLAGYVALYIGDIMHGVFAVFGAPQVMILTTVVLVAAGLLWASLYFTRRGNLA